MAISKEILLLIASSEKSFCGMSSSRAVVFIIETAAAILFALPLHCQSQFDRISCILTIGKAFIFECLFHDDFLQIFKMPCKANFLILFSSELFALKR